MPNDTEALFEVEGKNFEFALPPGSPTKFANTHRWWVEDHGGRCLGGDTYLSDTDFLVVGDPSPISSAVCPWIRRVPWEDFLVEYHCRPTTRTQADLSGIEPFLKQLPSQFVVEHIGWSDDLDKARAIDKLQTALGWLYATPDFSAKLVVVARTGTLARGRIRSFVLDGTPIVSDRAYEYLLGVYEGRSTGIPTLDSVYPLGVRISPPGGPPGFLPLDLGIDNPRFLTHRRHIEMIEANKEEDA